MVKGRGRLLSPRDVAEIADYLRITVLPELVAEYQEAFGYAFDRKDRPSDDQRDFIKSPRFGNTTQTIALEQVGTRDHLKYLARRIANIEVEARSVLGGLKGFGRPRDDYRPLAAYKEQSDTEQANQQDAHDAREKRRLLDELARIHDRERAIQHRLGALADA